MLPSERCTCETVNRRLLYVPGGADILHKSGFLSLPRIFPFSTSTRYAKLHNQPKAILTIGLNSRSSHDCDIHLRLSMTEGALAKSEKSPSNSSTAEVDPEAEISTEINSLPIFFFFETGKTIQSGQAEDCEVS
jgi:hypothetical protein